MPLPVGAAAASLERYARTLCRRILQFSGMALLGISPILRPDQTHRPYPMGGGLHASVARLVCIASTIFLTS
jgi:hypothetical protein